MDSTGDRNMMEFMFPGGFAMAQMGRPGLSSQQKEELWERWKTGQSLSDIGRALGKHAASVFGVLLSKGGIAPTARTRSRLSLSLQDREEISRGLVSGLSMRKIAEELGRSPSTISREIGRIMGGKSIVPPTPKSALGSRPCVQSHACWRPTNPCGL